MPAFCLSMTSNLARAGRDSGELETSRQSGHPVQRYWTVVEMQPNKKCSTNFNSERRRAYPHLLCMPEHGPGGGACLTILQAARLSLSSRRSQRHRVVQVYEIEPTGCDCRVCRARSWHDWAGFIGKSTVHVGCTCGSSHLQIKPCNCIGESQLNLSGCINA